MLSILDTTVPAEARTVKARAPAPAPRAGDPPSLDTASMAWLWSSHTKMSIPDPLSSTPRGSSLEGIVASVVEIYARVHRDQAAFLSSARSRGSPLACPSGCGSCCEPFVPDILPPEASLIAAWLLESEPGLAREVASWTRADRPAAPPCPFLRRADDRARCAIYPVRPLVCRLFGAAGVRDRDGRASFRPCAHMSLADYPPAGRDRPSMGAAELDGRFGSAPPVMADYSAELAALCPSEALDRSAIVEALPAALARVGLALSLAEGARDRTYSTHHGPEDAVSAAGQVRVRGR
jgi:uncharacterized protein